MKSILAFLACLLGTIHSVEARPNIVFIFADDWGWGDLGCHGHPFLRTPHLDRLAAEGSDFHRFTVASGVCSPSRAAVLTGHFPARYHIDGHFAWVPSNAKRGMPDWLDPEVTLLPRLLQEAGYATAHYGKWHLSNNMIPDSPLPSAYGYDDYGAFNCAGEQMPVHEDSRRAVTFMEKAVSKETPFFINLWVHEPHTPFHTVPKYEWRFREWENEAERIYASVISHADDRIGEVLAALDRLQVADNTLVVFSSDNGPAGSGAGGELELQYDTATGAGWGLGAAVGTTGGRQGRKGSLLEGGIGVPFLVRWPGVVPKGRVDKESLLSAVDLLPTFCEVAGVNLPENYRPDGVSQLSVLKGGKAPRREKPLFWKMEGRGSPPQAKWASHAVVQDEWKLLSNKNSSHYELYRLGSDPYEREDLRSKHPGEAQRLLRLLEEWKKTLPTAPSGAVFSAERKGIRP
ncbi:sulfatase [Roseibacillus ishigakijimensis]|uniref:Sulfatase-like hydrolase/transferase n=1 Tax=Roseibacillus ishigakijimensis TaxID=454146 RepID=A0A934VMI6_9BACT|nr:sulfatase-like hydrolase/transferase [Roseibacillus ishigakijimensis]MBK1833990.1 sulfatase-like hydrolase/transferase [Roseibacillus ishigakijimensis]